MNEKVTNPNDFKVVSFHNSTDFRFTPEMGCMYDGRVINDTKGGPGVDAGESLIIGYHIGRQLATNLAKAVLVRQAPTVDPAGIPTGVPLWDTTKLDNLSNSFLKELYSENKQAPMSETDKMMLQIQELNKFKEGLEKKFGSVPEKKEEVTVSEGFKDKAEVIAELTKREIRFDARKSKAELEKLLA